LFDLDADPYQLHNLIDSPDHSAVRQQLHDQLAAKLDTLKDDFFARANTWQATYKESS
jgi:hypothetical protein